LDCVNGDPTAFVLPARGALAAIDPLLPAFDVMPLKDAIDESLAGSTQIVAMTGMLAALALVIAIVGLYGVISYVVARRTREFGLRVALGARKPTSYGSSCGAPACSSRSAWAPASRSPQERRAR
jgi:hypothetical protein